MNKIIIGITSATSIALLHGQLRYFSMKGYAVYLISSYDNCIDKFCQEEKCIYLPVNITRTFSPISDFLAFFKILAYFIKIRPDIVNVGTPKMGLLGVIAAKIAGVKKRIFTCRGFVFEKKEGLYPKKILKLIDKLPGYFAHKIICVSFSIKELALREKIFNEKKCIVIGNGGSNGFNLDRFNKNNISLEKIELLKNELSIKDKFVYGFIGRLVDEKGIMELYKSFCDLYNDNNSLRLLIIGKVEIEYVKEISLLDKIKEHPGIVLAGFQLNTPLYLSLMDVFVFPSWSEGFSNVLVEAAAMGIPVISTLATGCRDAVCNEYNGLLIPTKNIGQLTMKMKFLYENESLRKEFGRNGIEWAKNFKNEVIWEGLEKLYEGSI